MDNIGSQLVCQDHKDSYQFIATDNSYPPLLCSDCMTEKDYQLPVSIKKVLKQTQFQFLNNWPPLGNNWPPFNDKQPSLMKRVEQKIKQIEKEENDIKKEINDFFEELKKDILVLLEFKKISLLETISKNQLKTFYFEIADISKLQGIIKGENNSNSVNKKLHKLIGTYLESAQSNINKFEELLKKAEEEEPFNIDTAQQQKKSILASINSSFNSSGQFLQSNQLFLIEQKKQQEDSTLSPFNSSDFLLKQVFQKTNKNLDTYFLSQEPLSNSLKYIIRFSSTNKQYSSAIGIVPQKIENTDTNWFKKDIIQIINNPQQLGQKYLKDIKKGQNIWGFQNNNLQMELRICIEKKQFEILDFPKYQNWAALNDKEKQIWNTRQHYYLGLYLHGIQESISIDQFIIVDEFPPVL